MNHSLAMRRLFWKEAQQLRPLVLILLLLGVLCHVLALIGSVTWRLDPTFARQQHFFVFLGLPGLFAVGAGALLVGQEKEQRTISWLSSLPISANAIVGVKLLACFAAWLLVWLASAAILLAVDSVFQAGFGWWLQHENVWVSSGWVMHSLFVLLIGIALAWKINSPFASLLLLVPFALLPQVCSWAALILQGRWIAFWDSPPSLLFLCQSLLCVVAIFLVWRFGKQQFRPIAVALASTRSRTNNDAWEEQLKRAKIDALHTRSLAPMPALTWQFFAQSRTVVIGLAALLICGFTVVAMNATNNGRFGESAWPLVFGVFLSFVAISWLGVSTFQSDRLHSRIRFLADRGVNPNLVWWTRQVVPMATMWAVSLILFLAIKLICGSKDYEWVFGFKISSVPLTMVVGVAIFGMIVVSITQWVSQVAFSPIIAAIAAPFVAGAAIYYLPGAAMMLGAPIWLLGLCSFIPWIATFGAMRRWMDGRHGIGYWSWHGGLAAAWLLIPTIPFLIAISTVPSMPSSVAREIADEALQTKNIAYSAGDLVLFPKSKAGATEKLEGRWSEVSQNLRRQLDNANVFVSYASPAVHYLIATTVLTRMQFDTIAEGADNAKSEKYAKCIELLTRTVTRMRDNQILRDQDGADMIECFILRELLKPEAKRRLGATYESTAKVLADSDARHNARRRAIAYCWQEWQSVGYRDRFNRIFGGYPIVDLDRKAGTFENLVVGRRRLGRAVADLWELAKAGEQGATEDRLKRIADYWGISHSKYGIGPTGRLLRPDDASISIVPTRDAVPFGPASRWFAGWERQAKKLLNAE